VTEKVSMDEQHRSLPAGSSELERRRQIVDVPGQPRPQTFPPEPYGRDGKKDGSQAGLMDYGRILRRRKGTVILIAFLGLLVGILITLPQTPVYQARTSLEVVDVNQDFLNMRQALPVSDAGTYTAVADIQTQIKILQSETLNARTVQKLRAVNTGDLKAETGRIPAWRKALDLPAPSPIDRRESDLRAAAAHLKVRPTGNTRIIELLFDSTNPQLAADFLNTLTNEYIDQNMEARWQMSQRTADWLGKQLDDMRIKLEHSEDSLQAYARQAGLMFIGAQGSVSEERLRQLQSSLSAAEAERIGKQSKWEFAKAASPEILPNVLNDASLQADQGKLAELQRQRADLITVFQPEYARVKRLDSQIAELEKGLAAERKSLLERVREDFEEAAHRESLLAHDYASQAQLVTADSEKSIQYNILKREVDSNRQIYDAMLQKLKESSIASAMRASNIRVVDAAKAPKSPYKPSLEQDAGLGLLAGLFLGIVFVVMREREDRTLQEPGETPFWLNLPELGVIPSALERGHLRIRVKYYKYYGKKRLEEAKPDLSLAPATEAAPDQVELVTWQRKPSMIAEAFRVVLTSLLFSGNNGSEPRVLVLTSAGPREGKSTVASNLAIALAEIQQKVLLIDADLRKPRQHEIFQVPNEKGLSSLLMERPLPPERLEGVVQQTKIPGLFLLPSGPATQAAASLLYSANLPELLARFKKEFDMVILDTPPMLQMPDARVIGRIADGVLLVFRAGQTTRDAAIAARQRFSEDETTVVGTILNGWDPKRSPNGYYGYYNGYSYRGYSHYSHYYAADDAKRGDGN
jgi:capsular exopolysaccharide synthesis family protein